MRELLLPAVAGASRGRRGRVLEAELRAAIRAGRLPPATRLPATRDLAGQLGLARGTVTAAYAQLIAEGYLVARHGSGTRVAEAATVGGPVASGTVASGPVAGDPAAGPAAGGVGVPGAADAVLATPAPARPRWRFDLRTGLPALGAFPRADWVAATRAGLAGLSSEALGYPDPAGLPELRRELVGYLGRVRAVAATPGRVVITNGSTEGLALVARVLRAAGHRVVAVEHPSHPGQRELLRVHGLTPVPVPVDEDGIDVTALAATGARAVVVTSAHQFPLGVVLAPHRRHALLAWARNRDAVVVEDDYDAEHRYDRPALGAVQALAPERVVYLGSVSKVLAPALRIGWLVAPARLAADLVELKRLNDLGCGTLPQAAFAHLLRAGGYDRHLRRTRALYRRRRDALVAALAEHLPHWHPVGVAAGLHVVVRLPDGTDDTALRERLARHGIHAPALADFAPAPVAAPFPGLVLGYTALSPDRLRAAVAEIARLARGG